MFCYLGNIVFTFFQLLEKGRLCGGGCGLGWAGTRIDKWESSCRRTTRIIPTLRLVLQYPSTRFPHRLQGRVGRAGGQGGVGEMETEIDRHSFGHLHHSSLASIWILFCQKFQFLWTFILHPNSLKFSPFGVERGDLTKWDIEQVFGTITCLLKTPTPMPHPTTKVSFYPDTVLHQDHHLHPT